MGEYTHSSASGYKLHCPGLPTDEIDEIEKKDKI